MSRDCTSVIRKGVEYYDEEIREDGGWELFRHLSSLRRSALCWYPFAPDSRVLEVGCGYGALTGILCEKAAFVEAVEKDPLRAEMTRKRYAAREDLRVTAADIDAFRPEDRFDYIVAVEFLETYEHDPGELLARLRSWLRPGGKLLLGFRNRRALKYLCGASDEFVRQPGNECVPGARLYTRREMSGLLLKAGFADPR